MTFRRFPSARDKAILRHSCTLGITATDTASVYASQPRTFTIGVRGGNSPVYISGLTNSASFSGGAVAPLGLVAVQGAMPGPAVGVSFSSGPVASVLAVPILYPKNGG